MMRLSVFGSLDIYGWGRQGKEGRGEGGVHWSGGEATKQVIKVQRIFTRAQHYTHAHTHTHARAHTRTHSHTHGIEPSGGQKKATG